MIDLSRYRMFVTGAGSGIGLASVIQAHVMGAWIAGTVRGSEQCAVLAPYLDDGWIFNLDVADRAALDRVVAATIQLFDGLDGALACAGIIALFTAKEITDAVWENVIGTNLTGCFNLAHAAARHIKTPVKGSIVRISSQTGLVDHPRAAAHGMSKSRFNGTVRAMALELASDNMHINAIGPGPTAADITAVTRTIPEQRDYVLNGIPMGRFGEPEETANINSFLLSDATSFVTGHVVCADRGYTAK